MAFRNKTTSKQPQTTVQPEEQHPTPNSQQHNGKGQHHHDGEKRQQTQPCPFGKACHFVNSEKGCHHKHPPEHIICRWDDKCTREDCQRIHPSRAEGSNAPLHPREKKTNTLRERPERQHHKKAQAVEVSTDNEIEKLRKELIALENKKKIETFKERQKIELKEFIDSLSVNP